MHHRRNPAPADGPVPGRPIDVVSLEGGWTGIDEHGVFVVTAATRDETVALVSRAGTSDLPVTVRIHDGDGVLEGEQTFPAPTLR